MLLNMIKILSRYKRTMTTDTIKITKAVTQEVEISRADLIKELSSGNGATAKTGDLVKINTKTNSATYGTKAICDKIGLVIGVSPSTYNPWSGAGWTAKEDRNQYAVNYKDCGGCLTTAYLPGSALTVL